MAATSAGRREAREGLTPSKSHIRPSLLSELTVAHHCVLGRRTEALGTSLKVPG